MAIFKVGMALQGEKSQLYFQQAGWFILGGMIFDALDGFVARMTRTTSSFGAMLDSLCDLVTFGVAPGFLVFGVTRGASGAAGVDFMRDQVIPAVGVLYAMCALIRLARFTVETTPDEESHQLFAGLPTPAAGGVVASIILLSAPVSSRLPEALVESTAGVLIRTLPLTLFVLGLLMTSRVPYLHVVNRLFRGFSSFVTLVEVLLLGVLMYLGQELAFFLLFTGYALSGPILQVRSRIARAPGGADAGVPVEEDHEVF